MGAGTHTARPRVLTPLTGSLRISRATHRLQLLEDLGRLICGQYPDQAIQIFEFGFQAILAVPKSPFLQFANTGQCIARDRSALLQQNGKCEAALTQSFEESRKIVGVAMAKGQVEWIVAIPDRFDCLFLERLQKVATTLRDLEDLPGRPFPLRFPSVSLKSSRSKPSDARRLIAP